MTDLKLEVGKTYNNRNGLPVKIGRIVAFSTFPANVPYNMDGRYNTGADGDFDLISEYTPPAQPTPVPGERTPLVHAEQRHDHADGYDIECLAGNGDWVDSPYPSWHVDMQYRRKPEPAPLKPNHVHFIAIFHDGISETVTTGLGNITMYKGHKAIRIEFNPNTQELVSAEVVTP